MTLFVEQTYLTCGSIGVMFGRCKLHFKDQPNNVLILDQGVTFPIETLKDTQTAQDYQLTFTPLFLK